MSINDKITIGTQVDHGKVTQAIDMMGSVTQRVVDMSVRQFEEGVREALVNLGWTPPGGLSAIPEILREAHEYGHFADNFDYPLAKPVRKAIRDMIDSNPPRPFFGTRPAMGTGYRYMPKEVAEVVHEMKTRRINNGRNTSPTLIAWANRIENSFDRPPVESLGRDDMLDELAAMQSADNTGAEPQGWKLVPVEADAHMENAASRYKDSCGGFFSSNPWTWRGAYAAMVAEAPQPPTQQEHPDDRAVDRFAAVMKAKLYDARAKGRSGWDGPECTQEALSRMLHEHVAKGDPRDVANLCMMLYLRRESILPHEEDNVQYHPATPILIQGLKKLGTEGATVIREWDKARARIDGGSHAASNLHAQQALMRCEDELREMVKLAGDYDLDEQAVASLETAIESMQYRRMLGPHAEIIREAARELNKVIRSGALHEIRIPLGDELYGIAALMSPESPEKSNG
jgi:hypothetical protein